MRSLGGRLLVVSLAAVLLLDFARSYYARIGSTAPTLAWPSKTVAEGGITWPPGTDLPNNAALGQTVYARRCAVCHGATGKGDGPAARTLQPRPRDFSGGVFKFKSVKGSTPPRLEDVRRSIRKGIAGTSMPAWHDLLTTREIDAVAEHIRQLGPLKDWSPPEAQPPASDIFAAASAERGRQSYIDLGCPTCHGEQARGNGPSAADLRDVWKQPIAARDLTAPWTYRWGNDRQTVYRSIAYGVSGTPMPGYLEVSDPQQIADVVAYLETLARVPLWDLRWPDWSPSPDSMLNFAQQVAGTDPVKRGEYLVRAGMCRLCHTPVDDAGVYQTATHDLAGGMKIAAGAHGIFISANLTSDEETGLGKRSAEEIALAIRTGHSRERRLSSWGMPLMVYGSLIPEDALAIATYLKTLPALRNSVPQPLYYGSLETVVRKLFYPWPALAPPQLIYSPGNFGGDAVEAAARVVPQTWLLRLQRFFVILALVAWFIARRQRSSAPRGHGGVTVTVALLLVFVGATIAFIERYPAIGPMPVEPIVGGFAETIPPASDEGRYADPMTWRGRYLFAVSSCAFCHNGDGSGGNKVSWRAFGSVWSANLTPHPSGLESWTDDDVLRLLRSGVRRDGRQLHWQTMPWDAFSSYAEEDLRSLLAFVRRLPAVEHTLPAAVPPRPDDCPSYTFWLRDSGEQPGCK